MHHSQGNFLLNIDAFYNELNNKECREDDYKHALNVWHSFEMKTLEEYHDLYMKTPTHEKPAKEYSGTPVAVGRSRTPLKSNQTVTRVKEETKFHEMLKAEKRTNELLQELVKLKKKKH